MINGCKNGQLPLTLDSIQQLQRIMEVFLLEVLGVQTVLDEANHDLPNIMMDAVFEIRKALKEKKDYTTADLLRDVFAKRNIGIKDTKEGGEWTYEKK